MISSECRWGLKFVLPPKPADFGVTEDDVIRWVDRDRYYLFLATLGIAITGVMIALRITHPNENVLIQFFGLLVVGVPIALVTSLAWGDMAIWLTLKLFPCGRYRIAQEKHRRDMVTRDYERRKIVDKWLQMVDEDLPRLHAFHEDELPTSRENLKGVIIEEIYRRMISQVLDNRKLESFKRTLVALNELVPKGATGKAAVALVRASKDAPLSEVQNDIIHSRKLMDAYKTLSGDHEELMAWYNEVDLALTTARETIGSKLNRSPYNDPT